MRLCSVPGRPRPQLAIAHEKPPRIVLTVVPMLSPFCLYPYCQVNALRMLCLIWTPQGRCIEQLYGTAPMRRYQRPYRPLQGTPNTNHLGTCTSYATEEASEVVYAVWMGVIHLVHIALVSPAGNPDPLYSSHIEPRKPISIWHLPVGSFACREQGGR